MSAIGPSRAQMTISGEMVFEQQQQQPVVFSHRLILKPFVTCDDGVSQPSPPGQAAACASPTVTLQWRENRPQIHARKYHLPLRRHHRISLPESDSVKRYIVSPAGTLKTSILPYADPVYGS